MAYIKFAVMADNEIFYVSALDEEHATGQKWIAAIRSDIKMICTTDYEDVHLGWAYKDSQFYTPDDVDMQSPLPKTIIDIPETNRYAGVIDGEVIGFMTFVKAELPEGYFDMLHAGMQSNPVIIELTDHPLADVGDIWNGTNFTKPLVP